eukprot:gene28954-55618_t
MCRAALPAALAAAAAAAPAARGPRARQRRQDHSDPANTRTWQQAYYVNDTFWVPGSDAPVFLCDLPRTKALMFSVEHRYYGCHNVSACPSSTSLKYLSSRQALADLAAFHDHAVARFRLTAKNKWISARVDMRGYNDVVAAAYALSAACRAAIAKGHADIGDLFRDQGGLFGETAGWYESWDHQKEFAGGGVMVDETIGDPVSRLAHLVAQQLSWAPAKWRLEPAMSTDYWGYQTCTEFAFYQTCEVGSDCFYTQGYVLLQDYLDNCKTEWGITAAEVAANVNATNEYYGGASPKCNCTKGDECVLYPNGEVDPWHSLSVLASPSPGIKVMMVPGASHHVWTHPSAPTDQQSVVKARAAIRAQIDEYINKWEETVILCGALCSALCGAAMLRAAAALAAAAAPAKGTVWWEWWDAASGCSGGGNGEGPTQNWAREERCVAIADLPAGDPLRDILVSPPAVPSAPASSPSAPSVWTHIDLRCVDPGGGSNLNALDDNVRLTAYTGGSCDGVGANASASSPAYVVVLPAFIAFLLISLCFNYAFQDWIERHLKRASLARQKGQKYVTWLKQPLPATSGLDDPDGFPCTVSLIDPKRWAGEVEEWLAKLDNPAAALPSDELSAEPLVPVDDAHRDPRRIIGAQREQSRGPHRDRDAQVDRMRASVTSGERTPGAAKSR